MGCLLVFIALYVMGEGYPVLGIILLVMAANAGEKRK